MLLIGLLLAGLPFTVSECTFPSELTGKWITSTLANLTFTSNKVGPFFSTETTMDCHIKNGSKYILRSPEYPVGPAVFVDYTCLDLTKITDTTFHYYELTPPITDSIFKGERKVAKFNNTDVTTNDICKTEVPTYPAAHSFMMEDGSLDSSALSFPHIVLGEFNVTMPGCEEGGFLDVCSDNTRLDFNLSQCTTSPFSDQMLFHAVYSEHHDNETYVTLYIEINPPESDNPFTPFSCMVIGNSSGNLSLTIAPGDCHDGQNSSSVAEPGVMMGLFKTDDCEHTSTETPTTTPATTPSGSSSQNAMSGLSLILGFVAAMWNV